MNKLKKPFSDKVVIITGGSRGIGRAITQAFSDLGAQLTIAALHDDTLERTLTELQQTNHPVECCGGDLANPATAQRIFNHTMERFGRVDVLVNCAGIITRTPMLDLAHEDWHQVINVNLHGTYYMCQAVLPQMCEQQSGKIINITSQMASMPHPGASPSYEVSKAAMAALTRHMALHFASHNIQINAVAPGSIDTDLPKSMSPEARQQLKDAIPLLRLGEPEEVAELVAFLASSKANYINGATIPINGGSFMSP